MRTYTDNDFDRTQTFIAYSLGSTPADLHILEAKLRDLKPLIKYDALNYSMSRFVTAELDCYTPGERGLGRLSTEVPRLGGHCRRPISKLRPDEIAELYRLIQDVIISGYIVHPLFLEERIQSGILSDAAQLFDAWLPNIYAQNPYEMADELQNAFTACGAFPLMALRGFLKQHRAKGGGLFGGDKTSMITLFYMVAGYGIRLAELGDWGPTTWARTSPG
jgi:hypothetical protein